MCPVFFFIDNCIQFSTHNFQHRNHIILVKETLSQKLKLYQSGTIILFRHIFHRKSKYVSARNSACDVFQLHHGYRKQWYCHSYKLSFLVQAYNIIMATLSSTDHDPIIVTYNPCFVRCTLSVWYYLVAYAMAPLMLFTPHSRLTMSIQPQL